MSKKYEISDLLQIKKFERIVCFPQIKKTEPIIDFETFKSFMEERGKDDFLNQLLYLNEPSPCQDFSMPRNQKKKRLV